MKIIEKAITLDGTKILLEDWTLSEFHKPYYVLMIGAYPKAKNSTYWIKSGEEFRLSISANEYKGYNDTMVKADFEALKNGTKKLKDLAAHFWNGKKDMWLIGMIEKE